MRFKNRFLLVKIRYDDLKERKEAVPHEVLKSIREAVMGLYGDYGSGCVQNSLQVRKVMTEKNVLVIRVDREYAHMVQAGIALVTALRGEAVAFDVVHSSGTQSQCDTAIRDYSKKGRVVGHIDESKPSETVQPSDEFAGADFLGLESSEDDC